MRLIDRIHHLVGNYPFHPILLAIFPALALMGHNIDESSPADGLRAVLLSLVLGLVALLIARLFLRDWEKSAIAASLFIIAFFSYGHINNFIELKSIFGFIYGRHRYIAPVWFGGLIAGWLWLRTLSKTKTITQGMNLVSILLLVTPAFQIVSDQIQRQVFAEDAQSSAQETTLAGQGEQVRPDIYYIILDAYTREDTLLSVYEFDNSPFLQLLEERGFFIADCSQSNYSWTTLSLSSSLNMAYAQTISPRNNITELVINLKGGEVRRRLEELGYSTIAFDSGYHRTRLDDADTYLRKYGLNSYQTRFGGGINEFESILIKTTAFLLLLDGNTTVQSGLLDRISEPSRLVHFNRINFILDTLPTVSSFPGPKFVFVHLVIPHEPYVFNSNGAFIPSHPDRSVWGYRRQVEYINSRLIPIVDGLIAESEIPPIIILQGDHGGGETIAGFERLKILNAYYFPGDASQALYDSITPVNTFRVLFDSYFDTELGLLPDTSYHSVRPDRFNLTEAGDDRPGCGD